MDEQTFLDLLRNDPDNEQVRSDFCKWLGEIGDERAEIAHLLNERWRLKKRLREVDESLTRWRWDEEDWMEVAFPLRVLSPSVGRCYLQPSPDKPPYVKVGDFVAANSVVCMIEQMKLFSEVCVEFDGVVAEIAVANGGPVEYNQLLIRLVRPSWH
jgi:biotin carboxyl carrier protein